MRKISLVSSAHPWNMQSVVSLWRSPLESCSTVWTWGLRQISHFCCVLLTASDLRSASMCADVPFGRSSTTNALIRGRIFQINVQAAILHNPLRCSSWAYTNSKQHSENSPNSPHTKCCDILPIYHFFLSSLTSFFSVNKNYFGFKNSLHSITCLILHTEEQDTTNLGFLGRIKLEVDRNEWVQFFHWKDI